MGEHAKTVNSVEELRALVGEEMGVSGWLTITQERVNAFAEATGDHQWIHVDLERARSSPMGGPIAHGYLTLSLLPLLRDHEWQGVDVAMPTKMVINYGSNRVRFVSPVPVGARIRLRVKLLSVDEVQPGVVQSVSQATVEIDGQEKPAMVAETVGRTYL
ncbi:MAG: MaoC family dehydratase [Chloroflexi bacterium]|nr:MaoC family dehydratase [Chloroflexota bacterium]